MIQHPRDLGTLIGKLSRRLDGLRASLTRSSFVTVGPVTVAAAGTTVAHGISARVPKDVLVTMTGAGQIWQTAPPDDTNIYLAADADGRTGIAFVR